MNSTYEKLGKALEFAERVHRDQNRKYEDQPYVVHPFRVCLRALSSKKRNKIWLATLSILHDVCEKSSHKPFQVQYTCGLSNEERKDLEALTWDKRGESRESYMRRCRSRKNSCTVKIWDEEDNLKTADTIHRQQYINELILLNPPKKKSLVFSNMDPFELVT